MKTKQEIEEAIRVMRANLDNAKAKNMLKEAAFAECMLSVLLWVNDEPDGLMALWGVE